jgi:hypothetical protein
MKINKIKQRQAEVALFYSQFIAHLLGNIHHSQHVPAAKPTHIQT